jgi:hypothetical protein
LCLGTKFSCRIRIVKILTTLLAHSPTSLRPHLHALLLTITVTQATPPSLAHLARS